MADGTGIEWADATWNPVRGCSRVSEGCRNCYAETVAARFSGPGQPYEGVADRERSGSKWTGRMQLVEHVLDQPLRWTKPRRIFVNSMSDLFHEGLSDDAIDAVFGIMALAPQHTFQVLTKRPARMRAWFARHTTPTECVAGAYLARPDIARRWPLDMERAVAVGMAGWPLPNVWLGVSVENQAAADERIPHLLAVPAARRFLSCEPLLEDLDLSRWLYGQGSESTRPDRHRGILGGSGGGDLAAPGRGRGGLSAACGHGQGQRGGLPAPPIHLGGPSFCGAGASNRLDGRQLPAHSARPGDQPPGRGQGEQSPLQPGAGHAIGERASQLQGVGPARERSARSEEYLSQAGRGESPRDPCAAEGSRRYAEDGSGAIRGHTADGFGDTSPQNLEARALIHWVIAGGESGPGARPMNPEWARSLRDQCAAAGVPYLHKQNGEWVSVSEVEGGGEHHTFPDGRTVRRVGKKAAGRLLDGVQHDGFPA